jgi:hypothetical protein
LKSKLAESEELLKLSLEDYYTVKKKVKELQEKCDELERERDTYRAAAHVFSIGNRLLMEQMDTSGG